MICSAETTNRALGAIRAAVSVDHTPFAEVLRDHPVVIFGAGGLGRRVLHGLREVGIEPAAFADNNASLWGTRLDAIGILNPAEAATRFGAEAIFVMATWRPVISGGLRDLDRQLRELGCRNVVPFPRVFWAFPETFSAHYLWDHPSRLESQWHLIESACALITDPSSRDEFAAQLAFRVTASIDVLPPIQNHAQYFPDFISRSADEHFVDCGAYNGDTIAAFADWTQGRYRKITAFEADPACYKDLDRFAISHPHISGRLENHRSAVAAHAGFVRFNATGNTSAGVSDRGGIEVPAVRLDDVLKTESPTFIKMDIEGAEPDALKGAAATIRRCQPVLAICVYHAQDHLWRIPLMIDEMFPGARYFLKSYCLDGLDTIFFALPPHRVLSREVR